MITTCGLAELRRLRVKLGEEFKGALMIAKSFYRVKCGHDQASSMDEENSKEKNDSNMKVSTKRK